MNWEQTVIVGNLTRDPEMRYLPSGVPVCNFTVAVNRVSGGVDDRREKTVYYRVATWRQLAETCNQYLVKGQEVMCIGTVDAKGYLDKDTRVQATLELTARDVRFGSGGLKASDSVTNDFVEPSFEGDIPF